MLGQSGSGELREVSYMHRRLYIGVALLVLLLCGCYWFDDGQFKSLLDGYLGTDVQKADSYLGDAGDVWENSTKSVEDDVITYYTLDDFQSIVVGEATAKEVSGLAIKKGVNGTELFSTAEGLLFRFPMENGQHICVDVNGADSKVSSIEIK